MTDTPFKSAAPSYLRKGWEFVFPTVGGVPPKGVTGYQREAPGKAVLRAWSEQRGHENIGIAMPEDVIAIDVDHGKKDGADGWRPEIEELVRTVLPATYSNGHGDPYSPYRHHLYRVPEGVTAEDVAAMAGGLGPGVDLIKWNHRWLRVAPSIHKSGEPYYWIDHTHPEADGYGKVCKAPRPEDLPRLTLNEWYAIKEIAGTVSSSGGYAVAAVEVEEWLNAHAGSADDEMRQAFNRDWKHTSAGSRHDAASRTAMHVAHLAEEGHSGARVVLKRLRDQFVAAVADDREGGLGEAESEWDRILTSAIGKAVTKTDEGDRFVVPEVTTLDVPFDRAGDGPADDEPEEFEEEAPYPVTLASRPYDFVSCYVERHHSDEEGRGLLRYFGGGRWGRFRPEVGHYVLANADEVAGELERLTAGATETVFTDGEMEVRPIVKNPTVINNGVKALATRTLVSDYLGTSLAALRGVVPFQNGLLDVDTEMLFPVTADWDVWWNVPLEWTGEPADCPSWLAFLDSLGWGEGTEEYRLLRQWFGYLLSGSKDQQKMLLLVGPTRSGKGTVLKVASAIMGDGSVGVRLDSLGERFGLAPLLGKSLATVGDARFENRTDKGLVQTLLSIVGDDEIGVEAKNKDTVSVRLDTRLMLASNEPPRFVESSDALAQRFLVLQMHKSFLGMEDRDLEKRLTAELPGIVEWALGGYRDLRERGSFDVTAAGREFVEDLVRASAPVRRFIEECCVIENGAKVEKHECYVAYVEWARARGLYQVSDTQFGVDLRTQFGDSIDLKKRSGNRRYYGNLRLNADAMGGY